MAPVHEYTIFCSLHRASLKQSAWLDAVLTAAKVAVFVCVIVEAYALPRAVPTAQMSVSIDDAFGGLREPMPDVKGLVAAELDLGSNKL